MEKNDFFHKRKEKITQHILLSHSSDDWGQCPLQTDRQTPYTGVCEYFFQLKAATSLGFAPRGIITSNLM
jgi:hypothetical protein